MDLLDIQNVIVNDPEETDNDNVLEDEISDAGDRDRALAAELYTLGMAEEIVVDEGQEWEDALGQTRVMKQLTMTDEEFLASVRSEYYTRTTYPDRFTPVETITGFRVRQYGEVRWRPQAKGDAEEEALNSLIGAEQALYYEVNRFCQWFQDFSPGAIAEQIANVATTDQENALWFVGRDGSKIWAPRQSIEAAEDIREMHGIELPEQVPTMCTAQMAADMREDAATNTAALMKIWAEFYAICKGKGQGLMAYEANTYCIVEGYKKFGSTTLASDHYAKVMVPYIAKLFGWKGLAPDLWKFYAGLFWGAVSAFRQHTTRKFRAEFYRNNIQAKVVKAMNAKLRLQIIDDSKDEYLHQNGNVTRRYDNFSQRALEMSELD